MSYIDELAQVEEQAPAVDREHVERRVDDWLRRLKALYAEVTGWAVQNGWAFASDLPVPMNEQMMQRVGLPRREQQSLVLTASTQQRVWFKPKGLSVIGANGRVDVYTLKQSLILLDMAPQFKPAMWVLHHLPGKPDGGQPFTPGNLAQLV